MQIFRKKYNVLISSNIQKIIKQTLIADVSHCWIYRLLFYFTNSWYIHVYSSKIARSKRVRLNINRFQHHIQPATIHRIYFMSTSYVSVSANHLYHALNRRHLQVQDIKEGP